MRFRTISKLLVFFLLLPILATAGDSSAQITIAAVGDIMMGSDYPVSRLPPYGGRLLLRDAGPYFRTADIAMANLEGPLYSGDSPAKAATRGRSYVFRTPPAFAANLKEAGISMVSLANNHANDFGPAGLASTKNALRAAGVAYCGKYGELAEFAIRGIKVGIITLSFGPPPRSIVHPAEALAEIAEAAGRYDILILSIHGGAEGKSATHLVEGAEYFLAEPRGDLIRFARNAIERGADLVVGHGPHVPRGMEIYQGRLIAYSLGNFCTSRGISISGASGYAPLLLAQLDRTGAFVGGSIESFVQKPAAGPRPDVKKRALQLVRNLAAADFPLSAPLISAAGVIKPRE
jgi:poly-gamma-glutamate capsule biosynthesis protein CapA/YwtB (metallophosphatase superfamily)